MAYKDKDKNRQYQREWIREKRANLTPAQEVAERARKVRNRSAGYIKLKNWFWALKTGTKCKTCPENHPACLDFHHRDPATKEYDISKAVRQGLARGKLLAELEKCDLICSNCHRKLHWNERNNSGVGPEAGSSPA